MNWLEAIRSFLRPAKSKPEKIILHCMIDLETMSLASNAYIRTLGACFFNASGVSNLFYESCDGSKQYGADIDPSTVAWWANQSEASKKALDNPKDQDLETVLFAFKGWVRQHAKVFSLKGDGSDVEVWIWGNGGDFDPVVLVNAFKRYKITPPWYFTGTRCYRTLKGLNRHIKADPFEGEPHNALDDAIYQAKHAVKILCQVYW